MLQEENKVVVDGEFKNSHVDHDAGGDGGSDDQDSDNEPHFEPLIHLPEVDVKTLEEDEEEMWKNRCQLYRFDDSEKPGEWKQRGTGVLKLLKHKKHGYVRLLMRRDVTLKVCANHYVLPSIELRKHDKSDRAWVWYTPADFADEEPKMETLAIRFKDTNMCQEFYSIFEKGKEIMRAYQKDILKCEKKESGDCVDEKKSYFSESVNRQACRVMLNLQQKLRQQQGASTSYSNVPTRISIRDKLLVQEVQELHMSTPPSCALDFPDPSQLHTFYLTIKPEEGMYAGGAFRFMFEIPLDYNNVPPKVKCLTKMYHPNIAEDGAVCLSLLRPSSIDGMGWAPTRRLKDVVWGLNCLFTDLIDFDDPLNSEAADNYRKNPEEFKMRVRDYIRRYCYTRSS